MSPDGKKPPNETTAEAERKQNVLEKGSFLFRSSVLKTLQAAHNLTTPRPPIHRGTTTEFPYLWAESVTALRANPSGPEALFDLGKIVNLQVAASRIHGRVFNTNEAFRFWQVVGPPWRLNGFTVGREIREGCLIPTVGGGLCQISGSLFETATAAGLMIQERHRHSSRLPGIPYKEERDATVFWNYIDLAFTSQNPFLVECFLTQRDLVVRIRGKTERSRKPLSEKPSARMHTPSANDCLECGKTDCSLEKTTSALVAKENRGRLILLDHFQPEFAKDLVDRKKPDDWLGIPLDGRLRDRPAYAWPTDHWYQVSEQRLAMFRRYLYGRVFPRSAIAAEIGLARSRILAKSWKKKLESHVGTLIVQQSLVPFLWQEGLLQGREYEVLFSHLPLYLMHERLQKAGESFTTKTLREFRADETLVQSERLALEGAATLVTPHSELKSLFPRARKIAWTLPQRDMVASAKGQREVILFPGPTGEREGASALREVARRQGLKIFILGSVIEESNYWDGLNVTRGKTAEIPWNQVRAVIHPTLFESSPRLHLRAVANQIPVIGTAACGLDDSPLFHVVKFNSPDEIAEALVNSKRAL